MKLSTVVTFEFEARQPETYRGTVRLARYLGDESRIVKLAGGRGLEPLTTRLVGGHSIRLSYPPAVPPSKRNVVVCAGWPLVCRRLARGLPHDDLRRARRDRLTNDLAEPGRWFGFVGRLGLRAVVDELNQSVCVGCWAIEHFAAPDIRGQGPADCRSVRSADTAPNSRQQFVDVKRPTDLFQGLIREPRHRISSKAGAGLVTLHSTSRCRDGLTSRDLVHVLQRGQIRLGRLDLVLKFPAALAGLRRVGEVRASD